MPTSYCLSSFLPLGCVRFGMSVNADSVLRSVYYKYVHPKEVFIAEGVLVPDIARKKNTATLGGVRKS